MRRIFILILFLKAFQACPTSNAGQHKERFTLKECEPNRWDFPNCLPCKCNPVGTKPNTTCRKNTGQCICKFGFTGRTCGSCEIGRVKDFPKCSPVSKVLIVDGMGANVIDFKSNQSCHFTLSQGIYQGCGGYNGNGIVLCNMDNFCYESTKIDDTFGVIPLQKNSMSLFRCLYAEYPSNKVRVFTHNSKTNAPIGKYFTDMPIRCAKNNTIRSQSFTSLMADLRQDINCGFAFSRCINGTFP